jgi:hypothetical protein
MTPEKRNIPDWAQQERQGDFDWIGENLDVFRNTATLAFKEAGRGAIVVDTTLEHMPGVGNPFGYFSQDQIAEQGNDAISRLVAEYDPAQEFVVVLLKRDHRTSTYRVATVPSELRADRAREKAPSDTAQRATEHKLKPPDVETLMAWEAEGGCEAACPHHCWVEPDGTCPHGNPSWLLKLGLI